MEKYSFEKAQDEANEMQKKVESGEVENYDQAENIANRENVEKTFKKIQQNFQQKDIQDIEQVKSEMEKKYGHEKRLKKIKEQVFVIRNWAASQQLEEGRDFIIEENVKAYAKEVGIELAEHDEQRFAMGISESKYNQFKDFFITEYKQGMREIDPKREVSLNFSWGGRFCVEGGVPCDTVVISDMESKQINSHHQKFKDFFQERMGFEFPSGDIINKILERIVNDNGIDIYKRVHKKLINMRDAQQLPKDFDYSLISKVRHCYEILERTQKSNERGVVELTDIYKSIAEVHSYCDLTYNIDDIPDLDQVENIAGIKIPKELQMDRIFDQPEVRKTALTQFNKLDMEKLCKEFADTLYNNKE